MDQALLGEDFKVPCIGMQPQLQILFTVLSCTTEAGKMKNSISQSPHIQSSAVIQFLPNAFCVLDLELVMWQETLNMMHPF